MKDAIYKSYDELPLFLSAKNVAELLGISISSAYELMWERDFPVLKIGSRKVIPKENSANGWKRTREAADEFCFRKP